MVTEFISILQAWTGPSFTVSQHVVEVWIYTSWILSGVQKISSSGNVFVVAECYGNNTIASKLR